MSFVNTLQAVTVHAVELPFPPLTFGIIAAVVFAVFGIVTFAYRDVANRHVHRPVPGATHHAEAPGAESHGTGHPGHH